ncbi:hypothetical protein BC937DRAFT_86619 [Endogone sp. FLAS-F59071]|nr:hypothetical protein BC937DRAFT_86619 [Endogone sp. FLAS-F59071]|eukprot:RUS19978.1 hypothetical protein BC937DRAFT_86619 [Endogone sp. FLAS-F59071]
MPTRFRPCIDLHNGQVKQIVGGSLEDTAPERLQTNFVSGCVMVSLSCFPVSRKIAQSNILLRYRESSAYYAQLYKDNSLTGAHVIKLGPGNDDAAKEALRAWPAMSRFNPTAYIIKDGLQIGGGITAENAQEWIDAGAEKVIITSYLFPDARFSLARLEELSRRVGKERLIVDVSCRRRDDKWIVAMNKWQTMTDMEDPSTYCPSTAGNSPLHYHIFLSDNVSVNSLHEFLIHAADVEGLCKGIDKELVRCLGEWVNIPTTYAGGSSSIHDLELVNRLSNGKVDLTIGSALDIFGGNGVKFEDCIAWNKTATVYE